MRLAFISLSLLLLASCAGLRHRYHDVQGGDSLAQIAQRYGVPVASLKRYNSRAVAHGLRPGTKLYIPFEESSRWNSEFTMESRDLAQDASEEPSVAYDRSRIHFSWPVFGYVSSGFGRRHGREHEGIDIPARTGTAVKSARSGHVIYAGNRIAGYGNLVIVRHADSFSTVYAHLSKIEVKKGQFVSRGHRLGRVGRTGRATSPHLHFEIRNNRLAVNPLLYLQGQYAHNILGR